MPNDELSSPPPAMNSSELLLRGSLGLGKNALNDDDPLSTGAKRDAASEYSSSVREMLSPCKSDALSVSTLRSTLPPLVRLLSFVEA
jgi:hypothetical protein